MSPTDRSYTAWRMAVAACEAHTLTWPRVTCGEFGPELHEAVQASYPAFQGMVAAIEQAAS